MKEIEKQAHYKMHADEALQALSEEFKEKHLTAIFQEDPKRFEHFSQELEELLFDYSKQRLDQNVLNALVELAEERDLSQWINRLFSQERVNQSENRAAMHWALRAPKEALSNLLDKEEVAGEIEATFEKMTNLVTKIHAGQYRGATGEVITDVVNIGVGGSDLGPLMATTALSDFEVKTVKPLGIHFVSTIDGSQLSDLLYRLRPETTLFIISSKSFGTIDTLTNAETVRQWLFKALGDSPITLKNHFIGVSANHDAMTKWGIHEDHQLQLWNWVGGRYSLWSSIGLPIALLIGVSGFRAFLDGAYCMDQHFWEAPFERNIPVLLGLIGIWNSNYLDMQTHAILPYDGRLKYFASYLQQLEMESNGKSINREDEVIDYTTCPIIWGEVGPNAQHAFYQLLHQGTHSVSADFIAPIERYNRAQFTYHENSEALIEQHQLSLANCLAQSRLLAFGNEVDEVKLQAVKNQEDCGSTSALRAKMQYEGNQPSTTILVKALTPKTLGMLIALYEHKVFVQSVIWNINPFDQWGVEKGKEIANQLLPLLSGMDEVEFSQLDSSTQGLILMLREQD
ncbi:glucose-6-phosphate isomerase [Ignatzschineria sp. LJL83]